MLRARGQGLSGLLVPETNSHVGLGTPPRPAAPDETIGAVIAGVAADLLGLSGALWIVAGLTFMSGLVVSSRMTETFSPAGRKSGSWLVAARKTPGGERGAKAWGGATASL